MKYALQIPLMGAMAVLISSCGNLASSLNRQNFDPSTNPLDSPGSGRSAAVDTGPIYPLGTYVEVTNSNAVIYHRYPKGNAQPDQSLSVGTPLKVVGEKGSYVKVETKTGQIGFVPALMVGAQPAAEELPPLLGIDSIDPVDPNGLPAFPLGSEDLPFVAPEPEVPPISVEETRGPTPAPAPLPVVPPDPLSE
jgi:hypothetical protein